MIYDSRYMKALSRPGLVSFLLCCTVLVLIGWERLLHPGLWAEDGKIFVPDALTLGWSSVLLPYEGYFHLLTRIFVRVFCYLPLYWLPWLINTFCFVLYAWMASLFSRSEYRGVVASDLDRILISLGICLIPGMYEILGNFCNTHRLLALAMFVMVIKPARIDLSKRDLFGTFVIAGSAGEVVAFVPAFLYRIFHRSREGLSISKELGVLGIVCLWTVANIAVRKTNSAPMHPEFFEIARATLAAWIFNFTIQPLT
ncbi:MAG: hypothetical protein EBX52_14190, partial [Proteobacteria bacterium]|nr:hypothetical protein [Pseudomonadota bacterium]